MRRITQDFELLKQQGYRPHLWLECHAKKGQVYYDGFQYSIKFRKGQATQETHHMYIHMSDIEHYTNKCLEEIYKLNEYLFEVDAPEKAKLESVWKQVKKEILPPVDTKSLEKTKEGVYYFPILSSSLQKRIQQEPVPHFKPTSFKYDKKEKRVTLYNEEGTTAQGYALDTFNYVLREYAKTLTGLTEVLDDFKIEFTAAQLVNPHQYTDYIQETKLVKDSHMTEDYLPYRVYFILLPTGEVLTVSYHSFLKDIKIEDLCDDTLNYGICKTLSGLNAYDRGRENGILMLQPVCVHEVTFKDNKLTVDFYCVARYGNGDYKTLIVPLHLLPKGEEDYTSKDFCYGGSEGHVSIPLSYLPYLDTSLTMEEFITANFLEDIPKPRQYKSYKYKY